MRKTFLLIFILYTGLLISQTKQPDIKVNLVYDPAFERIEITIKTEADSLNYCKVQIIDSQKKIIKTIDLPKAATQIDSKIIIPDLTTGRYTCFVYIKKEKIYEGEFFKDAILMEPQPQPVFARPRK